MTTIICLLLLMATRSLFSPVAVTAATTPSNPQARSINIMNESGRRVEIHWINPDDGSMVLQSTPDVLNGASLTLNSYMGHNFEVRELPAKKTMECAGDDKQCRIDRFTVKSTQDQGELLNTSIISSPATTYDVRWRSWCHIFGDYYLDVRCCHLVLFADCSFRLYRLCHAS
jgi:hypothetical protein